VSGDVVAALHPRPRDRIGSPFRRAASIRQIAAAPDDGEDTAALDSPAIPALVAGARMEDESTHGLCRRNAFDRRPAFRRDRVTGSRGDDRDRSARQLR
jgi:hypothetical protein